MKALGALLMAAGTGLLAGTAAAGPVPVPPIPTVTVTVPSTPVPVPLPAPSVPAPTPLPVIPKLPTPVEAARSSSPLPQDGGVTGPITSSNGSSSNGSTSIGSSTSSSGAVATGGAASESTGLSSSGGHVAHFRSSRLWIGTSGPRRRRTTTFTFVLPSAGRVVFTVNQVSPACVGIGRFSVPGHAGLNRVRFAGRLHGRPLGPGTYRISARTQSGRVVRRITLIVVGGSAPSREELSSLRAANTCRGGTRQASSALASAASGGGTGAAQPPAQSLPQPLSQPLSQSLSQPQVEAAGVTPPPSPSLHSGVLASSVQKTARAIRPLLVALLALSILFLGLASMPRVAVVEPRVNDLLVRHRVEIATLGAMALVAVAIAFLLA